MAQAIVAEMAEPIAPPAAAGPGVPVARPRRLHALHRRAPARAAGARGAQPHHRRALRARRAVHRPAPLQRRGPARRDATTCWPTATRWCMVDHDVRVAARMPTTSIEMGPGVGRATAAASSRRARVDDVAAEPCLAHRRRSCAGARTVRVREPGRRRTSCSTEAPSISKPMPLHTVQAARGGHPPRPPHRRHRRVGLGQDHAGAREPHARARRRRPPASAPPAHCEGHRRRGHQARQPHRRHAHRRQRALHGGHLLRCPRRSPPCVRRAARGEGARAQGGRLLLQYGQPALPHLRRHGPGVARRAVPARRRHPLSRTAAARVTRGMRTRYRCASRRSKTRHPMPRWRTTPTPRSRRCPCRTSWRSPWTRRCDAFPRRTRA